MKTYAAHGVRRFILCLGYKRDIFIDYFLNYHARATDITVRLGDRGSVVYHGGIPEDDWEVTLVDTGEQTMTGGRVARAARYLLPGDEDVFLTYGDGLADVDVAALLAHHRRHRQALTITAVHPSGRFGDVRLGQGGRVSGFHEKPQTESGLINGGFMVLRRSFIERYLTADPALIMEQGPMRVAARDGEMSAYVHEGFWQCMDTLREHQILTQLWASGKAPWTSAW
jgi:glucose-1-phosphate cytidylyltransferase